MRVGRWIAVAVVAVLAWVGLAYCAGPADAHEYRRTAVQAAQAGLNAVRTAALTAVADRNGKLVDPYVSVVLDDAEGAVASAQSQLAAQPPPDSATRGLRDELSPLLTDAARQLGDLDLLLSSGDRDAVQGAVDALRRLGDRLDDFVARFR